MGSEFLNRGRTVPTVTMAAPSGTGAATAPAAGGPSASGFVGEARQGLSDAMSGRVSLLMLNSMIIGLIGFYLWTHKVQAGG